MHKFKNILLLLSFFLIFTNLNAKNITKKLPEKPMVVIIPSYKNIKWYERNLTSIFMQDYDNFRVIYIDDCSPDGTGDAVERFINRNKQNSITTLKKNTVRMGAMANLYYAIHSCKNNEIAVLVDGDDWLYHRNVLKELNEVYSDPNIWFTHGKLIEYPNGSSAWCEPIPKSAIQNSSYRFIKHPTHLRTFYAGLFKKIKIEDFLYEGEFMKMAWDMAIMFPLLEMAEERHAYIKNINYVYNVANPINDNKVDAQLQRDLDKLIRNMPPYERLQEADFLLDEEENIEEY